MIWDCSDGETMLGGRYGVVSHSLGGCSDASEAFDRRSEIARLITAHLRQSALDRALGSTRQIGTVLDRASGMHWFVSWRYRRAHDGEPAQHIPCHAESSRRVSHCGVSKGHGYRCQNRPTHPPRSSAYWANGRFDRLKLKFQFCAFSSHSVRGALALTHIGVSIR